MGSGNKTNQLDVDLWFPLHFPRTGGTTGEQRGAYAPPKLPVGHHAVFMYSLHSTTSKLYVDQEMDIRTFYVTQDREKPTDSA